MSKIGIINQRGETVESKMNGYRRTEMERNTKNLNNYIKIKK